MALHLNLNHELERLRAERRRDPLKLTMIGLTLVAALFVVQYMWTMTQTARVTSERDVKSREFTQKEPLAKAAALEEVELRRKLGNSERFQARIEGRFYWAPLLQLVVENVPGNVHLTRLSGEVNADDQSKVQFKLEGLVAGAEPLTAAEEFRKSFSQVLETKYKNISTSFPHLDGGGSETVPIDGKAVPTATFSIKVQMQHRESSATPAPKKP